MSSSSEDELERLRAELAAERAKNKEMEEKQTQLRTELAGERGKRESLSNELQQCRKWNVELVMAWRVITSYDLYAGGCSKRCRSRKKRIFQTS